MATADDMTPRRLLRADHENARRQAALAAVTAELAAAGEPPAVVERAVGAAAELLEAHTVAAFLCRADGRGFDAAAARGLAPLEPGAPALSMERTTAGRAVARGTVEAVEDAAPARAAGTVFPRLAGDVPVGAVLAAPIAEGSAEPVGVLEVYAAAPRAWLDEDRELLRALAAACAVALRGAREAQALRDSEVRLALQYAVTTVLARSATLHDAIPALLQTICDQLGWEVGAFWTVDRRDNVLRCRDIWHRPSVDVVCFEARSRQSTFPPGVGLPGRVWASAAPAVIDDLAMDTNFPRAPMAVAEGLHGAVCFPIVIRNTVHGVMEFFSRDIEQLNASLLQVITTLGTQIGQFIERTRAEDALRESEARKGAILEAALDCIVTIDHEGKVIEFNQAAEKTFGYSHSEVIGRELAALIIPPALRDQHRTGLARYLATGEGPVLGRRLELTAMRADRSLFPAEIAIIRIPRDGSPLFTGHIRDITERKRAEDERTGLLAREQAAHAEAEQARAEAEVERQRLHAVFQQAPAPIALLEGPAHVFTFANPTYERVVRRSQGALIGRSVRAAFPELAGQGIYELLDQVYQTGEPFVGTEVPMQLDRTGTGALEEAYFTFIYQPLCDVTGAIKGILAHGFEVTAQVMARRRTEELTQQVQAERNHLQAQATQRKQMEEELRRFKFISDNATDAHFFWNRETRFLYVNKVACERLGYAKDELLRMSVPDIDPAFPNDRVEELFARLQQGRVPPFESLHKRKDGSAIPVEISVTGVTFAGEPYIFAVVRDIAERKQAETERVQLLARERAARAEAEAAQQRLAFLAEASNVLAASLDYEATLTSLARLAVPYFADWCGIDMVKEDGSIRQLAVAHVDPAKVEWAHELQRRYPIDPDGPRGVPHVLRTGQSEIYAEIPDAMLVASARDAEHLEILRIMSMKSAMLVPLVAHGRVLGVITFVAAESGRHYGPADLTLAEDFARRAALAVDNARLFMAARKDARRKAALAALTAELAAAGEPQAILERAVDAAAELLEAHTVAAFLRRADGRGFDAAAARGLAPLEPGAPALSMERSIAGRAVARGTVEAVEDAAPARAAGTVFPRLAGDVPVGAVLAAPIAEGSAEPIGVLEVYAAAPRAWPDEDRELLRALAATGAVALRQRRLLATTQDDARRLAALNRVAEVVIGAPTFGAMCDRALAVLTEVLDARAGVIHVYDETAPPERALRMVSWYGISDQAADAGAALPLGVGVIGQAALGRGPVVANGLDGGPGRMQPSHFVGRAAHPTTTSAPVHVCLPGLQGRASAPLLVRGRLLGVLTVATPEPRAWRAADLTLLQTVANQLAAALEAEQLRSAAAVAAAAREAERLKSELLSTVSHELRTPLGAIKGFASGLLHYGDRLDEAERTESLRSIDNAADRLTELIDNLLDLQRLEAGQLTMIHGIVGLAELATTVVTEMAPRAPNHTLDLTIAPDVPPVMGDARRLRQVLQNLIENAVKYSPDGGRIAMRAQAGPGVVELRVEDEGLGIPPDQLHAIFERFHRVDNSATRRIGGTGLGLAIVKGLVTAHGGTIHAESGGEGRGSAFVVTLPTPQKGACTDEG